MKTSINIPSSILKMNRGSSVSCVVLILLLVFCDTHCHARQLKSKTSRRLSSPSSTTVYVDDYNGGGFDTIPSPPPPPSPPLVIQSPTIPSPLVVLQPPSPVSMPPPLVQPPIASSPFSPPSPTPVIQQSPPPPSIEYEYFHSSNDYQAAATLPPPSPAAIIRSPPPSSSPPPLVQPPPPSPSAITSEPKKVTFTIIIPAFSVDSFDTSVRNVFIAAVQTAAILSGASNAPQVTIQSVKPATTTSSRRMLSSAIASSTGVMLVTDVVFDAVDSNAATNFMSLLQLAPRNAFPATIFGSVTVPDVRVGKVSSNKSTTIGLAVGLTAGCAAMAGVVAGVVIKRRRDVNRTPRPSILGKRKGYDMDGSNSQSSIAIPSSSNNSSLPTTPKSPSPFNDHSKEGGSSLKELYQAKQQLAGRAGLSSPGSQTPTRPPLSQLDNDIMASAIVFDNPLAEIEEESSEENDRVYNFPTPSALTNWFREARAKSLERKRQKVADKNGVALKKTTVEIQATAGFGESSMPKSSEFDVTAIKFANVSLNDKTEAVGKQTAA